MTIPAEPTLAEAIIPDPQPHWWNVRYEEAKSAIERVFDDRQSEESDVLNRLQALRLHIERLMSEIE